MKERDKHLQEALEALGQESRQGLGPHPALGDLEAFQERRLEPEAEAQVRDHVTLCPQCADLVLALAEAQEDASDESSSEAGEGARVSSLDTRKGWQRLERELGADLAGEAAPSGTVASKGVPGWFAIAASLLLGCVGILVGSSMGSSNTSTGVWANPLTLELSPVGEGVVRGETELEEVMNGPLVLILNSAADDEYPSYEAVVLEGETEVLRQDGLLRSRAGTVSFSLERSRLPAGRYRLHLYGLSADGRFLVEEYEAVIPPPA